MEIHINRTRMTMTAPILCHPTDCYDREDAIFPHHRYWFHQPQLHTTNSDCDTPNEDSTESIRSATSLVAVSDSALDPISGEATYNWRITTWSRNGLIEKSSFVNGNPDYMTSFRGELYGVNDLLRFIVESGLHQKRFTISCDNEAVVNKLQYLETSLAELDRAESELIKHSRDLLKQMIDYEIIWTRGHQDNETPFDQLPLLAQLNVECDAAAKSHLEEGLRPTKPTSLESGMKAGLVLDNHVVTTKMSEQVTLALHRPRMLSYI